MACVGREIAGGSYCMDAVRDAFAAAAAKLRRVLGRPGQATSSLLNRVIPLEAALSRDLGQHAHALPAAGDDSDDGEPDLAPGGPARLQLPPPQLGVPPVKGAIGLRSGGAANIGVSQGEWCIQHRPEMRHVLFNPQVNCRLCGAKGPAWLPHVALL